MVVGLSIGTSVLRSVLILLGGAVGGIVVFRTGSGVQAAALGVDAGVSALGGEKCVSDLSRSLDRPPTHVLILLGTVGGIVVLGGWCVDGGLSALAVLALVAIGPRHGLRSGAGVHVARMSGREHGAGMAGNGSGVSVLVREGLEVHGLRRIHFLAEAEQVERGIGADFIFHALRMRLREENAISTCHWWDRFSGSVAWFSVFSTDR